MGINTGKFGKINLKNSGKMEKILEKSAKVVSPKKVGTLDKTSLNTLLKRDRDQIDIDSI